jgi:hypothetical protein
MTRITSLWPNLRKQNSLPGWGTFLEDAPHALRQIGSTLGPLIRLDHAIMAGLGSAPNPAIIEVKT